MGELEAECGCVFIRGAQSSFVALPTLDDKAKKAKQFQRALRILKLQPFVHASQLNTTVSAQANRDQSLEGNGNKRVDLVQKEKGKTNTLTTTIMY